MRALMTIGAAALAATAATAGVATAAGGAGSAAVTGGTNVAAAPSTGVAPRLTTDSSAERIETPSGTYLPVTRTAFQSVVAGPVTVRFSGNAYASDWTGPDARFVGRSYAALYVRVLLDGASMSPGSVTFGDNTGKISVNAARPKAASFEWTGRAGAGAHTIEVQFRNRTTWDIGGLTKWSLVIQHS